MWRKIQSWERKGRGMQLINEHLFGNLKRRETLSIVLVSHIGVEALDWRGPPLRIIYKQYHDKIQQTQLILLLPPCFFLSWWCIMLLLSCSRIIAVAVLEYTNKHAYISSLELLICAQQAIRHPNSIYWCHCLRMNIVNCLYLTIFIVDVCLRNDYSWHHWLILILVKVSSYRLTISCNTFLAHEQLYIQASRKVMLVVASLNNQVYPSARVRIYLSLLSSSSHTVLLWSKAS